MTEPLVREVAIAIAAYVAAYPRAADTVEGVHQWWLVPRAAEHTLQTTQLALEQLESEGLMERHVFLRGTLWRMRLSR